MVLLPSIFPFSSGQISILRIFIHCGLIAIFLCHFSFISLPLILACILMTFGFYTRAISPLLLAMYLLSSIFHHEAPSIWMVWSILIFNFYPKGSLFKVAESKASALWVNALTHRLYALFMVIIGLSHLLVYFFGFEFLSVLNSEDPWSSAFPFVSNVPIGILEIICGLLAWKKGLSLKLWVFSSVFSFCALIFEPTEVSASFFLFHSLLFRLSFFRSQGRGGLVIYDGNCSLCHGFVCFLLKEDIKKELFYISNQDESLSRWKEVYKDLPFDKSVIYLQKDEEPLSRGSAVIAILLYFGGFWAFLGHVINLFPIGLIDLCYRLIAKIRYLLAPKPDNVCPLVPKEWQSQFHLPEDII